jgi:hypothetical protein
MQRNADNKMGLPPIGIYVGIESNGSMRVGREDMVPHIIINDRLKIIMLTHDSS